MHSAYAKEHDLVILDRLPVPALVAPHDGTFRLMVLDTETTGVDTAKDEIIELAYAIVEFNSEGELGSVVKIFDCLRQPELPILNSHIHGITDSDCLGQTIDWAEVASDVESCHLVAAHNAGFDRRIVERYCEAFISISWTCSYRDADYNKLGINSQKLDYLAFKAGFHFDAHRALMDVYATLEMIRRLSVFREMLLAAKTKSYVVYAAQAPFSAKEALKAEKYKPLYVNGKFKSWYTTVSEDKLNGTVTWLKNVIGCRKVPTLPITSKERYSVREEIV